MKKNYLILFALIFSLNTQSFAKIVPSSKNWSVLETENFEVIYPDSQQDLGLYYAQIAEEAFKNLSLIFKKWPKKTQIVLSDYTDAANGLATVFPYPMVILYPVTTENESTLSEASEWAKELVTHELTHIAQLYPYKNGYSWLRPIFGSIISPNLLTPQWWKEGMAVEMESFFSKGGRNKSFHQDAQIRAYVLSKKLSDYDLAQANETLISWPYGNRPYFFGSLLMGHLNALKPLSLIHDIVDDYSGTIPYFVNAALEKKIASRFNNEYIKTLNYHEVSAQEQLNTLNKTPPSSLEPFSKKWMHSKTPRTSQKYIALIGTDYKRSALRVYEKTQGGYNQLKLKRLPSDVDSFTFSPDEKFIYYSKIDSVSPTENYSDIYSYSIQEQKSKQLTFGARLREPVIAPDGSFIIATYLANGKTYLSKFSLSDQAVTHLVQLDFKEKLNSYTFLDNNKILFTIRDPERRQHLKILDITSLQVSDISAPVSDIRFLSYHNDTLYFNSSENGVTNIYAAKFKDNIISQVRPITHLKTGALSYAIDAENNKVYVTTITEKGYEVSKTDIQNFDALPKIKHSTHSRYDTISSALLKSSESTANSTSLPDSTSLKSSASNHLAASAPSSNSESTLNTTSTYKEKNYSGISYLLPRYWIPFVSSNTNNSGTLIQAMTSGNDPLLFHQYALNISYDTEIEKWDYLASYTNSLLDWPISITGMQWHTTYASGGSTEKNSTQLSIAPNIFSISKDASLSLGVLQNKVADDGLFKTDHLGPYILFQYSDITKKSHHYYPVSGYRFALQYARLEQQEDVPSTSDLGSYSQAQLNFVGYTSLLLPEHHVGFLKLNSLYTFEDVNYRFGTSTTVSPTFSDDTRSTFTLRGYKAGQFFGSKIITVNAEYRFPVADVVAGNGTTPLFFKYLTGHIIADAVATEGWGYTKNLTFESLKMSDQAFSLGAELRLSMTLGYVLPINFILGAYQPMNKKFADTTSLGLAFQMGL